MSIERSLSATALWALPICCGLALDVRAQSFSSFPLNPALGQNGVNIFPTNALPTDQVELARLIPNCGCGAGASLPLSAFASSQDIQSLAGLIGQLNERLQADVSRLSQGIAMSSALTVLAPNPGDRFSVTFGGSAFNSQGAGAMTATARLAPNVTGFVGYARSLSQNLMKGGVSFSIP